LIGDHPFRLATSSKSYNKLDKNLIAELIFYGKLYLPVRRSLMISVSNFQPGQILCLEHGHACLYAELIQIAPKNENQRGWVRPLVLQVSATGAITNFGVTPNGSAISDQLHFYDLRQGSDLLCPIILFRAALDTEVIPLLAQLASAKMHPNGDRTAHKQLQRFIRSICQVHSENF
jgi:hypothetical protein